MSYAQSVPGLRWTSNARFSPHGRWIAYASNESGRGEIYVKPFPGPGGKWHGVGSLSQTEL